MIRVKVIDWFCEECLRDTAHQVIDSLQRSRGQVAKKVGCTVCKRIQEATSAMNVESAREVLDEQLFVSIVQKFNQLKTKYDRFLSQRTGYLRKEITLLRGILNHD